MRLWPLVIFLLSFPAHSVESDICDVLEVSQCRGITKQIRRNSMQSTPSTSTAVSLNPSNTRFDKGVGVEAIAQTNNSVLFGLVTGTGKMGGALISGSMDNTFFGNRVPEHDEAVIERHLEDKQYKNKKLTAALGARLLASRKAGLDIGAFVKRHSEVKKINPGVGFSARAWNFHFGASVYRDDYDLDMDVIHEPSGLPYRTLWGRDKYQETFTVTTYTGGLRIKNVSLDVATISSKLNYYRDFQGVSDTKIIIYSASFYYDDFLFNAALRKEHSGSKTFMEPRGLAVEHDKSSPFFSVQYSFGKHVVFGVNYNYFLLKEVSGTIALFI